MILIFLPDEKRDNFCYEETYLQEMRVIVRKLQAEKKICGRLGLIMCHRVDIVVKYEFER